MYKEGELSCDRALLHCVLRSGFIAQILDIREPFNLPRGKLAETLPQITVDLLRKWIVQFRFRPSRSILLRLMLRKKHRQHRISLFLNDIEASTKKLSQVEFPTIFTHVPLKGHMNLTDHLTAARIANLNYDLAAPTDLYFSKHRNLSPNFILEINFYAYFLKNILFILSESSGKIHILLR